LEDIKKIGADISIENKFGKNLYDIAAAMDR
jgi:hypothetical protein